MFFDIAFFNSGPKGRRFKSCHLDHAKTPENTQFSGVLSYLENLLGFGLCNFCATFFKHVVQLIPGIFQMLA